LNAGDFLSGFVFPHSKKRRLQKKKKRLGKKTKNKRNVMFEICQRVEAAERESDKHECDKGLDKNAIGASAFVKT
jgi:hypothetical protein